MTKKNASRIGTYALIASAIMLLIASCAGTRNRALTLAEVETWPSKKASAYSADIGATLATSVEARMGDAPTVLLDYFRKADGNPSYASYSPSDSDRSLFSEYYALLPARFKETMVTHLIGIYFIEGFAGGGLADFAIGDSGEMYAILVLNPRVLVASLADWIAYRDASPYSDDGKGIELRSDCAGGEGYKGLVHTLTHEAAHIYDYFQHATPFVQPMLASPSDTPAAKDFTRGIWASYAQAASAYAIPRLGEIAPYGLGKRLPLSLALEQYSALAKTPFSSMYGAGSWAEDFAETAAWTWLREKLGIAYSVAISRPGAEEIRFTEGEARTSMARADALGDILD